MEILKKYTGDIILALAFMVIGVFIGLMFKASKDGIYINFVISKEKAFTIGKNGDILTTNFDLNKFSALDSVVIGEKIKSLNESSPLFKELQKLHANNLGPFKVIEQKVTVYFENNISKYKNIGGACKNGKVMYKSFNLRVSDERVKSKRMVDIQTVVPVDSGRCKDISDSLIIMNSELAYEWLEVKELPETLTATARLVDVLHSIE